MAKTPTISESGWNLISVARLSKFPLFMFVTALLISTIVWFCLTFSIELWSLRKDKGVQELMDVQSRVVHPLVIVEECFGDMCKEERTSTLFSDQTNTVLKVRSPEEHDSRKGTILEVYIQQGGS